MDLSVVIAEKRASALTGISDLKRKKGGKMKYGEVTVVRRGDDIYIGGERQCFIVNCFCRAFDLHPGFTKKYRMIAYDNPKQGDYEVEMVWVMDIRTSVSVQPSTPFPCRATSGWFTQKTLDKLHIVPEGGRFFWLKFVKARR